MSSQRKTVIALAIGAAALASPMLASAQQQDRGWYLGGSLGQMEAEGDCTSGLTCDRKDSSWKLFGGYRINRNFAVEAFYANWGEIKITNGVVTATGKLETFGLAGLGILPVGRQFELFGKLGLGSSKQKFTASGPGITVSDRDSGSDLLFGLGGSFNFSRNFALRAEWERLNDSEVNAFSIGVQYKF
jgi:OOP family OmpA-OmpF porin